MTRRRRAVAALVPLGLLVLAGQVRAAGPPTARYSHDPEALVIAFEYRLGEFEGHPPVRLEVWGDGRAAVRHPDLGSGAASREVVLLPWEVQRLVDLLATTGVLAYDGAHVREQLAAAETARQRAVAERPQEVRLFWVSDPEPTFLEVHVAAYLPEGPGGPVIPDVSQAISWPDLKGEAGRFPELAALQGLLAAQRELRTFMSQPGLRR